jgi:ATP-dependent DNA helicase RecG
MTSALTRLARILDLEEKQGWRNRAVIGGMAAMSERWANDARAEAIDPLVVNAILVLLNQYDSAAPTARPALAEQLRHALTADPADLADLVEALATPEDAPLPAVADDFDPDEEMAFAPPEPTHVARERIRRQQRVIRQVADLQAPVTILSGVGGATAEQLARLNIHRVSDLLWHLPTRHEDYTRLRTIAQLQPGEQVTVIANLWDVRERKIGVNRQIIQGILADGTGTLHATWWNRFVRNQLTIGTTLRFSGRSLSGAKDA